MSSMTGYGKAEYSQGGITLVVEIKTVNNRNFDLNTKIPRSFIAYEDLIRKTVSEYVRRGRIDLFITFIDSREKESQLDIDFEKAESYYKASNEIAKKLNLENDVTVASIMRLPDIITNIDIEDEDAYWNPLEEALKDFDEALEIYNGRDRRFGGINKKDDKYKNSVISNISVLNTTIMKNKEQVANKIGNIDISSTVRGHVSKVPSRKPTTRKTVARKPTARKTTIRKPTARRTVGRVRVNYKKML